MEGCGGGGGSRLEIGMVARKVTGVSLLFCFRSDLSSLTTVKMWEKGSIWPKSTRNFGYIVTENR